MICDSTRFGIAFARCASPTFHMLQLVCPVRHLLGFPVPLLCLLKGFSCHDEVANVPTIHYYCREQLMLQGHCNPICGLATNPGRTLVVSADVGPDSMIIVWDALTGEPLHTIPSPTPYGFRAIAMSQDGSMLAAITAPPAQQVGQHVQNKAHSDILPASRSFSIAGCFDSSLHVTSLMLRTCRHLASNSAVFFSRNGFLP